MMIQQLGTLFSVHDRLVNETDSRTLLHPSVRIYLYQIPTMLIIQWISNL